MYSQNFAHGDAELSIPKNYDGTAFFDEGVKIHSDDPKDNNHRKGAKDFCDDHSYTEAEETLGKESGFLSSFGISKLISSLIPKNLFSVNPFHDGIGIEELLILGIAAFLLFSSSGDKECAIMLLALLFVT